jgi:hypothetical protein
MNGDDDAGKVQVRAERTQPWGRQAARPGWSQSVREDDDVYIEVGYTAERADPLIWVKLSLDPPPSEQEIAELPERIKTALQRHGKTPPTETPPTEKDQR